MAAADSSPLTTHVLNTADGVPAARMALSLHRLEPQLMIWNMLTVGYGLTWRTKYSKGNG